MKLWRKNETMFSYYWYFRYHWVLLKYTASVHQYVKLIDLLYKGDVSIFKIRTDVYLLCIANWKFILVSFGKKLRCSTRTLAFHVNNWTLFIINFLFMKINIKFLSPATIRCGSLDSQKATRKLKPINSSSS